MNGFVMRIKYTRSSDLLLTCVDFEGHIQRTDPHYSRDDQYDSQDAKIFPATAHDEQEAEQSQAGN